jgi:hypothetical protein
MLDEEQIDDHSSELESESDQENMELHRLFV